MTRPEEDVCDGPAWVDHSLRLYLFAVVLLAVVGLSVVGIQRYLFHASYPRNTLLYEPNIRFTDFTSSSARVRHFGDPRMLSSREYGGKDYPVFPYPTPAVYPHLFYNQFSRPLRFYLASVLAVALAASVVFVIKLTSLSGGSKLPYLVVLVTLLTPFPLVFLLDRGNLEGLIWFLVMLGIWLFYRTSYYSSAIVLALAASMKIFPALLFLLFIAKKKYSAFAVASLTVVLITIVALAGVGPTLKQAALDSSLSGGMLTTTYIVGFRPWEIGWDHSIMAAIKQALYLLSRLRHVTHDPSKLFIQVPGIQAAVTAYGVLAPLSFAILYWRRVFSLPILNQLIVLLLLSVLLPFVSNEYTLVHVYVAWGAFLIYLYQDVRKGRVQFKKWVVAAILICFAVIFSPQSYWVFGYADTLGGQIKMAAMVTLLGLMLVFPMPSSGLGDLSETDLRAPGVSQ
jgi:hypothetical protein